MSNTATLYEYLRRKQPEAEDVKGPRHADIIILDDPVRVCGVELTVRAQDAVGFHDPNDGAFDEEQRLRGIRWAIDEGFLVDPQSGDAECPHGKRWATCSRCIETNWCGCCGRAANGSQWWCKDCERHVLRTNAAPWDRTFAAQYGRDCPFQE